MTDEQFAKLTDYLNKLFHKLQEIEKLNSNILHQVSKNIDNTEKILKK